MDRLTQIILTMALLAIIPFQIKAQRPVMPPSGLTQERWELTYDDYRAPCESLGIYSFDPEYPSIPSSKTLGNLKKEVVMVRDRNDVYIRGIFSEYAGSWIKGTIIGDRLVIPNNQILDAAGPIYFHCGATDYFNNIRISGSKEDVVRAVIFTPEDGKISLDISVNGKTMTPRSSIEDFADSSLHVTSFWFDNDERGDWTFEYNRLWRYVFGDKGEPLYKEDYSDGCGFPDIPYAINMVFRKIEE